MIFNRKNCFQITQNKLNRVMESKKAIQKWQETKNN